MVGTRYCVDAIRKYTKTNMSPTKVVRLLLQQAYSPQEICALSLTEDTNQVVFFDRDYVEDVFRKFFPTRSYGNLVTRVH